jgi:beta-phosphoglucomutase-like phosphatase (HAD superfamily)
MTLAILDIDGPLVDTNYQHALAWYRAFRKHGLSDALSDARMSV